MKLEKVLLKDICELLNRGVSPKYSDNGNLIINQKCIRNNIVSLNEARYSSLDKKISPEKYIQPLDILVNSTGTGTLGRTAQVKEVNQPISVDTHITIVRANNTVDKKFIGFQLSLKEPEIVSLGKGATNQQELGRAELGGIEILLPPLHTQRRIASILSAYDDLIENNIKRIKLLEESAQRTYEEWFVKFRVNGKPLPFDKNIGLPKGFKLSKFDLHFTINNGYAFKSKDYTNQGIKILRTKDYSQTKWINIEQPIYLSEDDSKKYSKYFVKAFDLMLIMVGASIGNYGIVLPKDIGILQNQNQWAIRSRKKLYELYKILMMENVIINLLTKKTGSARDFFRAEFLKEMDILIPPEDIIIEFNKIIEPIYSQISMLHFQNQLLKESRDILLPKLMNGTVNVE